MRYSHLRNILSSAFSIQTGLDKQAARALYERALKQDRQLRDEVKRALRDSTVDWRDLLMNEDYEVYHSYDSEDAIGYARRILCSDLLGLEEGTDR